jgi:hypothetical protein
MSEVTFYNPVFQKLLTFQVLRAHGDDMIRKILLLKEAIFYHGRTGT